MESLEAELAAARALDVADLADAIESVGFECTRCGGCCTGYAPDEPGGAPAGEGVDEAGTDRRDDGDAESGCHGGDADREPHTATVFPDEVRRVADAAEGESGEAYDWRDVARPMPFGLETDADGDPSGETFEWALATDGCGDCTFYEESDGEGACTVHDARPLICRTYPFSVALDGTSPVSYTHPDGGGRRPRSRVRGARPRHLPRGRRGAGRRAEGARGAGVRGSDRRPRRLRPDRRRADRRRRRRLRLRGTEGGRRDPDRRRVAGAVGLGRSAVPVLRPRPAPRPRPRGSPRGRPRPGA
ncbi:hypothetical protein C464_13520 [Halorubrum coriense DSM 10284]|uniref:Fe-S oxidoreductase n=1 Tax=Halorubrum coriense DSM 10284 TaxID=1227466 RepID=M0EDM8_9EURY|nr:hypothetical protein C464_13520 [Halorubrum coriense DSM 10284]